MRTSQLGRHFLTGDAADMPLWKWTAAHAYYWLTWPYRRWCLHEAAAQGRAPVMVVFYHRIADDQATPWTLDPRSFRRQVSWLARHFDLVTLTEARRRIVVGRNPRPCVSITFDDGYSDNCREALPWLVREGIPCTYFVTLRNMLTGEPFPHDLAMGKALTPNTLDEVRAMATSGIEIGAHSDTHPNLAEVVDPEQLRREIVLARDELERLIRRPVRYFAFPFGQPEHLDRRAMAMAREAGYDAVCSAYGGYNFPGGDGFHLRRIPADGYLIRLKNWMTLDPRKLGTFANDLPPEPEDAADLVPSHGSGRLCPGGQGSTG
ncbi:MAG: polysaccharide deacetylase family protein [Thermoguttaceae bacterium]|jgi:peptidoglycan/xylan/chitin deacetylase (PgdA/CDA1 family)|nr:polysaccharide deacetylase family protein [Thermoguttaceae bacterium]